MARILDLPNEILHEIAAATLPVPSVRDSDGQAARVDCTDLLSLRQTSKRLSENSTLVLAQTPQFQAPSFVMTEYGLKALCAISKHPVLGPAAKTLSISPYSMKFDRRYQKWKCGKLSKQDKMQFMTEFEQHDIFVKFDSASRMLAEALGAFPNLTTLFIHGISRRRTTRNAWGAKSPATNTPALCRTEAWHRRADPGSHPHGATEMTICATVMAIGKSGIQLQSLVLDRNMLDLYSAHPTAVLPRPGDTPTRRVLEKYPAHLNSLTLSVEWEELGVLGFFLASEATIQAAVSPSAHHLASFVKLFPSLRELEIMAAPLKYNFREAGAWFGSLSGTLRLPELRKLTLTNAWGKADTLLPLILAHDKLEEVELRHLFITFYFDAREEWRKIVTAIQTRTKVRTLRMSKGFQHKDYPGYHKEFYWNFKEVDSTRGGTERLIESGSHEAWNSEEAELVWLTRRVKHERLGGGHKMWAPSQRSKIELEGSDQQ
jgi:hypothetical protein